MKRIVVIGSRRQGKAEQMREITKAAIESGAQIIMLEAPPIAPNRLFGAWLNQDGEAV